MATKTRSMIIQKTRRIKLINAHRIDGEYTDVTYEVRVRMRPRQRKKKRPVREEVPEVREIPDLIESKIVPGLFYNLFSRTLLYEDKIEESPPLVFQLLLFLEFNRGEAKKENILENCWKNPPADATFRSQISEANKVLMELNVTANISSSSGVVKWE